MNDFITALQFLSRIRIVKQKSDSWDKSAFSRSVPWFPLVGAVIGLCLAGLNYILLPYFDTILRSVILVFFEILLTGGLFCDGLMDTSDGVFSGRKRELMLEIMKDSRVGANGIVVFIMVVFLKIAIYQALNGELLTLVLFAMPIATRLAVVFAITHFNYARTEGTGGLFTRYTDKRYSYIAFFMTIMLVSVTFTPVIYLASVFCLLYCLAVALYLSNVLGGLTGDTYGFIAETGNVAFIFFVYIFVIIFKQFAGGIPCLL